MDYINHFGEQSADYLKFRPDYPKELYDYLISLVKANDLAWDCGTGNGQTAAYLANYFKKVIATDINQAQLDVAIKKDNISYFCWPAEKTHIAVDTVDLITISQALHWFNFDAFYDEVKKVSKPEGIIAAWCYSLGKINPELDHIVKKLYEDILGDNYWPKERKYIDEAYETIPFPFKKFQTPYFCIEKKIHLPQLIGYLHTWSAVKEYEKRNHNNPVNLIEQELKDAWGDLKMSHLIHWPIHLLVGVVGVMND